MDRMSVDNLPKFRQKYDSEPVNLVDIDSFVRVGDKLGAKINSGWNSPHLEETWGGFTRRERLTWQVYEEYRKARAVHQAGISSPNILGVYDISVRSICNIEIDKEGKAHLIKGIIFVPAILMEYIEGQRLECLEHIGSPDLEEAIFKSDQELNRAKGMGFTIGDTHYKNRLWDPKSRRAYLIDFEQWEMPKVAS